MKQVPIYDVLGKRLIEIPADFDMIAPGVNLVPDDGMIVVIPASIEGNFTLHKYLGERQRKAWREALLADVTGIRKRSRTSGTPTLPSFLICRTSAHPPGDRTMSGPSKTDMRAFPNQRMRMTTDRHGRSRGHRPS